MAKTTQKYIEDLMKFYGRIVGLGFGNVEKLVETKNSYLNFCEDVEEHNMFEVLLNKSDRAFLEMSEVTDFTDSHKRLEEIVRNQFLLKIHGKLLGKGIKYYFNWFHKNWTRFNLRYWSPPKHKPREKVADRSRMQQPPALDKAYYKKLLAELVRKHNDLKKALPRRRHISKSNKEKMQAVIGCNKGSSLLLTLAMIFK